MPYVLCILVGGLIAACVISRQLKKEKSAVSNNTERKEVKPDD